jgi:hypothetical protein
MQTFVVAEVRAHQAFPERTMVGHPKVKQLMNDYVVDELGLKCQELIAERKRPSRRA